MTMKIQGEFHKEVHLATHDPDNTVALLPKTDVGRNVQQLHGMTFIVGMGACFVRHTSLSTKQVEHQMILLRHGMKAKLVSTSSPSKQFYWQRVWMIVAYLDSRMPRKVQKGQN